jgi:fructose-1,6-bisphosphatase/inositol monophosphatase family enzyme
VQETVGSGEVPALTDTPTWVIDPIDGRRLMHIP